MGNKFTLHFDCTIGSGSSTVHPSSNPLAFNNANPLNGPVAALTATVISEFVSPVAALRLFKALVVHGHELIPRLAPKAVKDIQIMDGLKHVHFPEGSQYEFVVHKIHGEDMKNLTFTYEVIEGDVLRRKHDSIYYKMTLEQMAHGGSVVKHVGKYHTKPSVGGLTDEEIKAGEENAGVVFKAVEAYLLAHPQAFAEQE